MQAPSAGLEMSLRVVGRVLTPKSRLSSCRIKPLILSKANPSQEWRKCPLHLCSAMPVSSETTHSLDIYPFAIRRGINPACAAVSGWRDLWCFQEDFAGEKKPQHLVLQGWEELGGTEVDVTTFGGLLLASPK